ncbi:MAG: CHAP domain-containing protein [Oscillospiraceae bacterium]|nr:CHAP domain-containing protein [Oscillospiraceae bacterium]
MLKQSAMHEANSKILLQIAAKEVGTQEDPPGSNNVKYLKEAGVGPTAWCVAFVWWCFKKAGFSAALYGGKKVFYCPNVYNWAKENNLLLPINKGRPGDIILFDWEPNGVPNHVGLIESVEGSVYHTIEGNWRNMVCRVNRPMNNGVFAVIRPDYGDPPPPELQAAELTAVPEVYTVAAGDTLFTIAQRYLGDGRRWHEIAAANNNLDPRKVSVGMKLKIPVK